MSQPIAFPVFRAFDHSTGAPLAGGLVNFYVTRTSTRQNTYTDATLAVPNANPVVLDANGEAQIWPLTTVAYTIVLTDSVGNVQWTINDWSASAFSAQSLSGNNILLNGGMEIWQPGISYVGANNLVLNDGWAMNLNSSGGAGLVTDYTISRQTGVGIAVDSQYCMRVQRNAASTATRQPILIQNIETLDVIGIRGNTLVLTFVARVGSNWSGGSALAVQMVAGTGAVDESYQNGLALTNQSVMGTVVFNVSTTPQTFTAQFAATGNSAGCVSLSFLLGLSTGTAGANDYIEIDDVKLEIGISATPGIDGPADHALRRCQRRYYKTFPQQTVPAQNAGVAGAFAFPQVGAAAVATNQLLALPSWMRETSGGFAPGVITTYNPSAANAQVRDITVAADATVTTPVFDGGAAASVAFTTAAGSASGNLNRVHYTMDKRF